MRRRKIAKNNPSEGGRPSRKKKGTPKAKETSPPKFLNPIDQSPRKGGKKTTVTAAWEGGGKIRKKKNLSKEKRERRSKGRWAGG